MTTPTPRSVSLPASDQGWSRPHAPLYFTFLGSYLTHTKLP